MLRIQLLGTFQLTLAKEAITAFANAPRLQSLLGYLVLHPEEPHSRNHLATFFWPTSTPSQAKTNLRKLLYKLRQSLPQPDTYLWQEGSLIGWRSNAAYTLDVTEFQQLLSATEAESLPVPQLQQVLALYQGELLPAVYDDWVIPLRQELQASVIHALEQLINDYQQQAEYDEAIGTIERLLAIAPYTEATYRWLMQLHGQKGDWVKAIQTYQTCVAMLRKELDAVPDPDTERLYKQLLIQKRVAPGQGNILAKPDKTTAVSRQDSNRQQTGIDSVQPPIPPYKPAFLDAGKQIEPEPSSGFIGRERELARLTKALETAVAGDSQIIFVSGDAGQGKTTLVTEFARRAQTSYPDLLVATGMCDAYAGVGDPYLPFRDIFAILCADVETRWQSGQLSQEQALRLWTALPDTIMALLARGTGLLQVLVDDIALATRATGSGLNPELLHKLQNIVETRRNNGQDFQQHQLFEQCVNVLRQLSQKRPIILILDDLQWADTASLSLLFHFGRRLARSRILIIGTYRPTEVALHRAGQRHPLDAIRNEFQRLLGDIFIDLDKTPAAENEAFVNQILDQTPNRLGKSFRQALFHRTAGHPLYTTELLHDMQERQALIIDEDGNWVESAGLDWKKIPTRVEGIIAERLNRLDSNLRQTLDVACIQGETFTAEVLSHVQGLENHSLIRQLSLELERNHQLIRENGQTHLGQRRLSFYAFRHSLFQQFLYQKLGPSERVYLHEAVGLALETIYEDFKEKVAAQCARHFDLAGNREKAIEFLLLAGKRAWTQYAHQEAIAHLSRALELLPQKDAARRFDCLLAREKIFGVIGEREQQRQDLDQLQTVAETLTEPGKLAEVALRQTLFADALGDLPVAIKSAQKTVQLAQRAGNIKLEAAGLYQWGKALWHKEEDAAIARDQIEQALMLAHQEQVSLSGATSLFNLGVVQEVARIQLEKAVTVAQKAEANQIEANSLYTLGVVTLILGDLEGAKSSYGQALVKHRSLGNLSGEAHCLSSLGVLALIVDADPGQAFAYHQDALFLYEAMGHRQNEAIQLGILGDVAIYNRDYDQAQAYRRQALAICREISAHREVGYCLKELGAIARQQGHFSQAGDHLQEALMIFRELADPRGERMTLVELGILWRTLGDYDAAHPVFESTLLLYKEANLREGQSRVMSEIGLVYHQSGDFAAARQHCQAAVAWLQQTNSNQNLLANALIYYAYVLRGEGAYQEAFANFAEASQLQRAFKQMTVPIEQIAGKAQELLSQGDRQQSLTAINEILTNVIDGKLENTALPGQIFLTCYQVLQANADPRATTVLAIAQRWLQDRLTTIEKDAQKQSFLQNVPAHRALMQLTEDNA